MTPFFFLYVLYAPKVRVHLIATTLKPLLCSRQLCARREGLREGPSCEPLPSLIFPSAYKNIPIYFYLRGFRGFCPIALGMPLFFFKFG